MPAALHRVAPRPAAGEAWLVADRLSCERGGRDVFRTLDIILARGHVLQIEGANGSGKTSLLRILAGLLIPAEGAVFWRGTDIRTELRTYCGELCFVGHMDGLKSGLTARENLRFARTLRASPGGCTPDEALERLGMAAYAGTQVAYLSSGQRRRVALARLLLGAEPLWILDEPFAALDEAGIGRVEALLAAHAACGGLAVVSTHQTLRIAHDRLVLSGGS